jgi:ethanolamine ammonia-lyase small subunit
MSDDDKLAPQISWPEMIDKIRARTPARIFVNRGAFYSTKMQQDLRSAHADAVDAVWSEFDLRKTFPADFVAQWELFQVSSQAESKSQFLLRPDLGRKLNDGAKVLIARQCPKECDLQIVIGDGLSAAALSEQVPALFPHLAQKVRANGWSLGRTFAVRYCRVGIMNDIGELLAPGVLVLLIGERPGLATAASLSAYMAYRPGPGQTDANRNLISNIHPRGVPVEEAAARIIQIASRMFAQQRSGTALKEDGFKDEKDASRLPEPDAKENEL